MAAAAVIRSACRAFRGSSSFPPPPRALLLTEQQRFLQRPPVPRDFITSRRLYSSDHIGNTPKLNKGDYPGDDGSSFMSEAAADRMCSKLDKMIESFDRQAIRFKQIEENMQEDYERLLKARGRVVLFGTAAIITGIVLYVNRRSKKTNKAKD